MEVTEFLTPDATYVEQNRLSLRLALNHQTAKLLRSHSCLAAWLRLALNHQTAKL